MKNIWISGSINSGKSTVAKILSKELKMAVIELDAFSGFVENFLSFDEYLKLNYEIFSEIVEVYNKRNIGVIIVYPIGEERFTELKDELNNFLIFALDPTLEVALTDRGDRKLNDWEIERVKYHYEKNIHNSSFAIRIVTKDKTPEETVTEIISKLI
jgi:adenylate kinase family enzyme